MCACIDEVGVACTVNSLADHVIAFFRLIGEFSLFCFRAIGDAFRLPFEFGEITTQIFEIGWRSTALVAVAGFAIGIALAMQTRASMTQFGAEAMVPEAVSFGLFKDVGPLVTALLVSGRAGAGIGAQLAGMRVTEQIDALESLAVDSFKYLVVTRIAACVIALPILTTFLDFSGLAGGWVSELSAVHMPIRLYLNDALTQMGWSDYIPSIVKTLVFGFIIGSISCFLGYNATKGATGIGRASTRSVVYSSILVILSDVILVKIILLWFQG